MIIAITGGSIERNEKGQMVALVKTLSHFGSFQKLSEKIGLEHIEAVSNDSVLSTNSGNPTKFVSSRPVVIPKGEKVLDLLTWTETIIPMNIICNTETIAEGVLKEHLFLGRFYLKIDLSGLRKSLEAVGKFELYIA
jgi:hypothetical protein